MLSYAKIALHSSFRLFECSTGIFGEGSSHSPLVNPISGASSPRIYALMLQLNMLQSNPVKHSCQ